MLSLVSLPLCLALPSLSLPASLAGQRHLDKQTNRRGSGAREGQVESPLRRPHPPPELTGRPPPWRRQGRRYKTARRSLVAKGRRKPSRAKAGRRVQDPSKGRQAVSGKMSMGLEIGGIALSVVGWMLCILCCALPMWRVTAFIGYNIVTAQYTWEGLWMDCVVQSTGQMQCKVYDSMLILGADIQAARALTVIAIVLGGLGLLVFLMGAKCTRCMEDEGTKAKITITAGAIFILAGLLTLIPVSWSANQIIRNFYSTVVPQALKRELGAALYVGWAASLCFLFGGSLLCCSCPPKEEKYRPTHVAYSAPKTATMASYDKKNYV